MGAPLRLCELPADLDVSPAPATEGPATALAQAAALACGASRPTAIDFLHSRLAPKKRPRLGRRTVWAAAAAAAVLAAGAYLYLDWRSMRQEVLRLRGQMASSAPAAERAGELVDRIAFAGGWYDRRPPMLDCLLEITRAFPQEGRVWATSVAVREDMQVLLTGKSVNEAAAMDVLDRLKSSPRLVNVKPLYIRQAGGTAREVSFAASMNLRGAR